MKIQSNSLFQEMMKEYKIPDDFSFKLKLPREIESILNDQILINDLGITLKNLKIEDDGMHYISDRLSFYTRRKGEEIINIKKFKKSFWAILIIDI